MQTRNTTFRNITLRTVLCAAALSAFLAGCYQPGAVFTETEHDFGPSAGKTVLKHTFIFANRGSAPLRIDKIHAG